VEKMQAQDILPVLHPQRRSGFSRLPIDCIDKGGEYPVCSL
jgi:hypothetical protein